MARDDHAADEDDDKNGSLARSPAQLAHAKNTPPSALRKRRLP